MSHWSSWLLLLKKWAFTFTFVRWRSTGPPRTYFHKVVWVCLALREDLCIGVNLDHLALGATGKQTGHARYERYENPRGRKALGPSLNAIADLMSAKVVIHTEKAKPHNEMGLSARGPIRLATAPEPSR
jgi:hypothetical protein